VAGGRLVDRRARRVVTGRVLHIGAAEGRPVLGGRLTLKLGADQTSESYSLLRGHTPPGLGPPLHVHELEDETFYVLHGTYEMQCGGELVTVGPGACIHLPRFTPHTFCNAGSDQAELLEFMAPGGIERYFDAVGFLGPEADDLEARSEVSRPYGISFPTDPTTRLEPPPGESQRPIKVATSEDGRRIDLAGYEATCMVESADAGRSHSLLEVELPPGGSLPLPGARSAHALVFVVDGRLALESADAALEAETEDAVAISRGIDIELANADGRPTRLLLFSIEAGN